MDLKNGILTIDGFDIGPDTSAADTMQHIEKCEYFSFASIESVLLNDVCIDEIHFAINVLFENGKLRSIEICPLLNSGDNMSIDEAQDARREISDTWLRSQLCEPDIRNEENTEYDYTWGCIMACSSFSGKDMYEYGYITILYKNDTTE